MVLKERTIHTMAKEVYYQFPQTPEQLRRLGARGGKTAARHWRERRSEVAADEAPASSESAVPGRWETTAEAIARLDAEYPWLRGAERPCGNRARQAS